MLITYITMTEETWSLYKKILYKDIGRMRSYCCTYSRHHRMSLEVDHYFLAFVYPKAIGIFAHILFDFTC